MKGNCSVVGESIVAHLNENKQQRLLDITPKECTLFHGVPPCQDLGWFHARFEVYLRRDYSGWVTCPQANFENLLELTEHNFQLLGTTYVQALVLHFFDLILKLDLYCMPWILADLCAFILIIHFIVINTAL